MAASRSKPSSRLRLRGELHGIDARRAERLGDQARGGFAEAGGIDGDAGDAPDVLEEVDEAGEQRFVRLAGPGEVLDDLGAGLLDEGAGRRVDEAGDGEDGGVVGARSDER